MKREIQLFFTALMFYSRIPCPKNINHDADLLNRATRYFPFIGYIVGAIGIGFFILSYWLFDYTLIAVIFMLAANILTTGAFHEDGFADVCDGFGGGWTKDKILDIMKDSRVGAYGAIGIICMLVLKVTAINLIVSKTLAMDNDWGIYFILIIISAHTLSRYAAVILAFSLEYVREDELSKAKPIAKQHFISDLIIGGVFSLIPLLCLAYYCNIVLISIPISIAIALLFLRKYFKKWIGGYTGDCLGATQQICEIIIYLNIIAIWKFML